MNGSVGVYSIERPIQRVQRLVRLKAPGCLYESLVLGGVFGWFRLKRLAWHGKETRRMTMDFPAPHQAMAIECADGTVREFSREAVSPTGERVQIRPSSSKLCVCTAGTSPGRPGGRYGLVRLSPASPAIPSLEGS